MHGETGHNGVRLGQNGAWVLCFFHVICVAEYMQLTTSLGVQGPQLYYVDNDCTRLKAHDSMPYFSVGSGSMYAYGVLDTKCVVVALPASWDVGLDSDVGFDSWRCVVSVGVMT